MYRNMTLSQYVVGIAWCLICSINGPEWYNEVGRFSWAPVLAVVEEYNIKPVECGYPSLTPCHTLMLHSRLSNNLTCDLEIFQFLQRVSWATHTSISWASQHHRFPIGKSVDAYLTNDSKSGLVYRSNMPSIFDYFVNFKTFAICVVTICVICLQSVKQ